MIIWRYLTTETYTLEPEDYRLKIIVIYHLVGTQPKTFIHFSHHSVCKATKEDVHNQKSNRTSIKKSTCCRNNTSLNKITKWSAVLKQLSSFEDFMFIKKGLGQLQKLMTR